MKTHDSNARIIVCVFDWSNKIRFKPTTCNLKISCSMTHHKVAARYVCLCTMSPNLLPAWLQETSVSSRGRHWDMCARGLGFESLLHWPSNELPHGHMGGIWTPQINVLIVQVVSFTLVDRHGRRSSCKKWKDVPFSVLGFEDKHLQLQFQFSIQQ